jgi:hypothetical protein
MEMDGVLCDDCVGDLRHEGEGEEEDEDGISEGTCTL